MNFDDLNSIADMLAKRNIPDIQSIFEKKNPMSKEKTYDRIYRIMNRYNTEDILSAIIEYQLIDLTDPLRLNKAELIAGLLLKFNVTDSKYCFIYREYLKLLELAESVVLQSGIHDLFQEGLKVKNSSYEEKKTVEKSFRMKLKHIFHRGDAYAKQLIEFATRLYSKFDAEILSVFGFTYTQCQDFIIYLFQQYYKKTDELNQAIIKENFQMNLGKVINNDTYMVQSIKKGYTYRVYKEALYMKFGKELVDNIINYLSVRLGNNNKYESLEDFNILYAKPIIDFGDYIYLALPINAIHNLPKLFHYEFITGKKIEKSVRDAYTKCRGDLLEKQRAECLKRVFNKGDVFQSLFYYQGNQRFEADVIAIKDDITIICECKSKLLVLNSLKGDLKSLESDFKDAIGDAYNQVVRTHKWIEEGNSFIKELEDGSINEIIIPRKNRLFEICVVAEHFGWIPVNLGDFIKVDDKSKLPLVINIYDLDILTREVKSFNELIKYLIFRRDFQDKIMSIDELEIFCAFKENVNIYKEAENKDIIMVDGYTEEIDIKYYEESHNWVMDYKINYI